MCAASRQLEGGRAQLLAGGGLRQTSHVGGEAGDKYAKFPCKVVGHFVQMYLAPTLPEGPVSAQLAG